MPQTTARERSYTSQFAVHTKCNKPKDISRPVYQLSYYSRISCLQGRSRSPHGNIRDRCSFDTINQSLILSVQMQKKHWTGHQGRMQPPLTGAHKNNVSKSNKRQYFTEKKNLVDRNMFKSNIQHKLNNSGRKPEILAANTTLSGNFFQKFMTRLWIHFISRMLYSRYKLQPLDCVIFSFVK